MKMCVHFFPGELVWKERGAKRRWQRGVEVGDRLNPDKAGADVADLNTRRRGKRPDCAAIDVVDPKHTARQRWQERRPHRRRRRIADILAEANPPLVHLLDDDNWRTHQEGDQEPARRKVEERHPFGRGREDVFDDAQDEQTNRSQHDKAELIEA